MIIITVITIVIGAHFRVLIFRIVTHRLLLVVQQVFGITFHHFYLSISIIKRLTFGLSLDSIGYLTIGAQLDNQIYILTDDVSHFVEKISQYRK